MPAARRVAIALLLLALPATAMAQLSLGQDGRARLRNSQSKPQTGQKLDEAARKINSDDPDERLEGVRDLTELAGETKTGELLLQAASDGDGRVRLKAIDTIGSVKAKEATPFLVQQLFLRDIDFTTTQHVLVALGKIGDQRATKPLLDYVSRNVDPRVRGNAIFALGELGDPAALEPLRAIAKDGSNEELQHVAAQAARKIEQRPAPEVIPPALAIDRRQPPPATP